MRSRRGQAGLAAALLCAAAATPRAALGSAADDAEREARELDEQITFVEKEYARRDESETARVRRKFGQGEVQFLLEDWSHAAVALYEVLDEPEFRRSADYPTALYYLGEALYQQGSHAAAQPFLRQALDYPEAPNHRGALVRALDLSIRLGAPGDVEALIARARASRAQLPPEAIYLTAKALYVRKDLPQKERARRALEALAAVPPPYHLAAAYLTGALHVEAGDLGLAAASFRSCVAQQPRNARQKEQRELCSLGLARVDVEMGRYPEAFDRYQDVPGDSPRFNEALYETASAYMRAQEYEQALRTAVLVPELAPGSPLAPEAVILQGRLQLKLGRYAGALDTYDQVVSRYGSIRDQIDGLLTGHRDPVLYFNELIGRSEKAFDVSAVLPPLAVKWASAQADLAGALKMVATLDQGKRDLDDGEEIADRLDAALSRGDGLEAFPHLGEGHARAEAVENAGVKLQARIVARHSALLEDGLDPWGRAQLAILRGARVDLEDRIRTLPSSPREVEARAIRLRSRLAEVGRSAFQLGYTVEGCRAIVSAAQLWLDRHRDEVQSGAHREAELHEEMRKHREVVDAYQEELALVRRELLKAEDAVAGAEVSAGEEGLRAEYRQALGREWQLLAPGEEALPGAARREVDRLEELGRRIAAVDARAEAVKRDIRARARAGIRALRGRVQAERRLLAAHLSDLDGVQGDAKNLVGRMAYHSFRKVRAQFYRLVLKADAGIVEVAWERKRERLEKIQQLSVKKAADLAELDDEFQGLLREVR